MSWHLIRLYVMLTVSVDHNLSSVPLGCYFVMRTRRRARVCAARELLMARRFLQRQVLISARFGSNLAPWLLQRNNLGETHESYRVVHRIWKIEIKLDDVIIEPLVCFKVVKVSIVLDI